MGLATPNPNDYQTILEPHARGSILVAAVFEAFISIYKNRVADLLRIATGGSGILPEGEIHPDLVDRLADEAAKSAQHILNMCIRALDYCPPVDITFGDYLRGIITADFDILYEDSHYYRLAFIDAFRRRGIYPVGIRTLSEDSLRHKINLDILQPDTKEMFRIISEFLRDYREEVIYKTDRFEIYKVSRKFIVGDQGDSGLHGRLWFKFDNSYEFEKLTGLIFNTEWQQYGAAKNQRDELSYSILNLRLLSRVGPDGSQINQIVFSMVQRMGVIIESGTVKGYYSPRGQEAPPPNGMEVQGGCTLIFDLDSLDLKYAINKPLFVPKELDNHHRVVNHDRIMRQYEYQNEQLPLGISEFSLYFENSFQGQYGEPFSLLHKH